MRVYFSASSLAFYPEDFKKDYEKSRTWPVDTVLVSPETFDEYALQEKPIGKRLSSENGFPAWVDDTPTKLQDTANERGWRNMELGRADIELYKVQDSDNKSTGSVSDWRSYRKALRSWPEHKDFPNNRFRPKAPDA